MNHFSKFACLALSAALLLNGCKGKDGDPGPAGTPGTSVLNLTGSMVGFVNSSDEFGRSQAKNGVTVTLENVTPAVTATTDANGRFELLNVRSGIYTVVYSRAGFGTLKEMNQFHLGGDQPTFLGKIELIGISATTVPTVAIGPILTPSSNGNYTGDYAVSLTATLANSTQPNQSSGGLRAMVFIGNSASVTSANGIQISSLSSSGGPYQTYLTRYDFNRNGFVTGTTAYAIVYGAPSNYYYYDYGYIDIATGRTVYTTLSATPSRVVTFIVP